MDRPTFPETEPDAAARDAAREKHTNPIRPSFWGRLRGYFFAGMLVTAPIGITVYLAWLFISFVDNRVRPLIPARYDPETYLPFSIPGIGLVIVVLALTLIGAATAGFLGRSVVRYSEHVLARMPVVRSIYGGVKQIFETVLANRNTVLREVVLVEFPRPGMWVLGFVTGQTADEVQDVIEDEVVNVFVPKVPNPTTGFLVFVPRRDCVSLAMSVEDGLKTIVSGGIVTPPDRRPLAARARRPAPSVQSPVADDLVDSI
jgi:uncharacterized membrane protein